MHPNPGNNNQPPYNYQGQSFQNPEQPPLNYDPAVQQGCYPQQQGFPPQGYQNMTQPQPGYSPNQYPGQMSQQACQMPGYPPAGQPYPGQQMQGYGYPPGQYVPQPCYHPRPAMVTQAHTAQGAYPPGAYPTPGTPYVQPQSVGQILHQEQRERVGYVNIRLCAPSLKPLFRCTPSADIQILSKAAKGIGCDTKAVFGVLTHRSRDQREMIKHEYSVQNGKSLIERMKSEGTQTERRLVMCLLHTAYHLDAYILYKSMKGAGTDESSLRMILCTRSGFEIAKIREIYPSVSDRKASLQDDISDDTSGAFRKILLRLVDNPRKDSRDVNQDEANKTVAELYSRSDNLVGAPVTWISIFCDTGFTQLQLIMKTFHDLHKITLCAHIKKYYLGDYEKTLLTICNYAWNPVHYFSKYLNDAIRAQNIMHVIYVFCSRCEIDLATISQHYLTTYQATLDSAIQAAFQKQHPEVVNGLLMLLGL